MVEGRGGRRPPCSVRDCIFHFLYIRCSAIFGVCFATTFFDLLGPLPCRQAFGLLCQKFPTHPPAGDGAILGQSNQLYVCLSAQF